MNTASSSHAQTPPLDKRDKTALLMFCVLLVSYVINAMDRQLFSVLAKDVRTALDLSLPEVGLASTVFTLGMGVAGIPTGYLLAKMARKNVVMLGLVIFSIATYMTAYANGLPNLLFYRFISGLGEAMQLTAILAIGTTYFVQHRAVAASSLNFTFGIGAVIGPNLGAAILRASDWQSPFILFGLLGIPALILIIVFVKPWFSEAQATHDPQEHSTDDASASSTLWSRTPVLLSLATICAGLSIYGYLGLYPTFLRDSLGFSPEQAGFAISFYGFGALLSLLGGWLGDRFNYTRLLTASLFASALAGGLLFTPLNNSVALHAAMSFIFGAMISGMVYANLSAGIIKSVVRAKASMASGLFVASLYIPAAFAGYLLGTLRGITGWTNAGIIQLSGFAILAAILSLLARPQQQVPSA